MTFPPLNSYVIVSTIYVGNHAASISCPTIKEERRRRIDVYGLCKNIDLSFLVGLEVNQVAIGEYQVQFHFDQEVSISVESQFTYHDGQHEWNWQQGMAFAPVAARTVALISAGIQRYEAQENGSLSLAFSNGHRLMIFDSSKEYESYTVSRPGVTIVV